MTEVNPRRSISGIVFDLDGTLIDSRADIASSVNYILGELGYVTLPLELVMGFVGDGAGSLIRRAARLPEGSAELAPILERYIEYYTAHAVIKTTWMPGAIEAMDALSHFPLALCTNKPHNTTLAVLDGLGARDRFDFILGGGVVATLKPDPLPMITIADRLGCATDTLVVVGDGPQDIEAGKSVGAFTIGVRGGIAAPERLMASGPDLVLESLWELPEAIARLRESQ